MKQRLSHPLGKPIAHNTPGNAHGKTALPGKAAASQSSVPSADAALKTLKTTTKLARVGGQAATSIVGGPATDNPI